MVAISNHTSTTCYQTLHPPLVAKGLFLLQVWVGSVTEVTINELSAEDSDTLPEGLEFIVTPPSNGHLALKSAPSRHILNFTQDHIQTGQLVFVHSGELIVIFVLRCLGEQVRINEGIIALLFTCRCSVRWLSLPSERRRELCPSTDFQHHCPLPGPHPAEEQSPGGLPR